MTTTDQREPEPLTLPVPLLGREIHCRMPSPEQLLVWQRTIKRLTDAPVDASWTGAEVMSALERLRKIIDSLMANRADVNWLDDQFLEGTVSFQDLAPFITLVTEAFARTDQEGDNRETKRAVKKAARKKATTS